jgi:hypothetical protein
MGFQSKGPPDFHRQRPLFFEYHTRRCSQIRGEEPLAGTPEENKAAVHGGIGTFGTYTVNEADKTFTVRFEAARTRTIPGPSRRRHLRLRATN